MLTDEDRRAAEEWIDERECNGTWLASEAKEGSWCASYQDAFLAGIEHERKRWEEVDALNKQAIAIRDSGERPDIVWLRPTNLKDKDGHIVIDDPTQPWGFGPLEQVGEKHWRIK